MLLYSLHLPFFYRCSLFLWDKERDELVAKVFDGEIPTDGNDRKVCGQFLSRQFRPQSLRSFFKMDFVLLGHWKVKMYKCNCCLIFFSFFPLGEGCVVRGREVWHYAWRSGPSYSKGGLRYPVDKSLVIPLDNAVGFSNAYPLLHRDFSGGQQHIFSEQLGPDENGI